MGRRNKPVPFKHLDPDEEEDEEIDLWDDEEDEDYEEDDYHKSKGQMNGTKGDSQVSKVRSKQL